MPRGDRTGPYGEGPKTGRQMGYCVGNEHPGFINMGQTRGRGFGRRFQGGFGYGRGFGRALNQGSGNFFYGTIPDVSEKTMIENEIRILKDQLSSLEERLSGIGEK